MSATAGCSVFQSSSRTKVVAHNALSEEAKVMLNVTNTDRNNKDPLPIQEVVIIPPGEQDNLSASVPLWDGHLVRVSGRENVDQPKDADVQFDKKITWENVETPLHVIIHPEETVFTVGADW